MSCVRDVRRYDFQEEIAVHQVISCSVYSVQTNSRETQRLYHPNVVLMMGACTTGDRLMIVQVRVLCVILGAVALFVALVFVLCRIMSINDKGCC